ncbi:MAG: LD-carboxypeptidase, partial [Melioribacteraceae bacterium]|nr:LD-carboxypeptidase [Melioribacteraceae bacterium]
MIKQFFVLLISIFVIISCKSVEISQSLVIIEENIKIKPPKLQKGDKIGLIAPGSYISQYQLDEAIDNLNDLGYEVFYNESILKKHGYLAGFDSVRAGDLQSMFLDPEIKGIMAVRGGYGCSRLLPLLDYEIIKSNPKILIGYSDITSLLYGIYSKSGLVSFHGPVGTSTFNDYSTMHFDNILTKNQNIYTMKNLSEDSDQIYVIKDGVAKGELVGGNLSIVVSLIGTEYDVGTKDKIIFLEDIGEEPYRIDRMLTQMRQSGKFDSCSAVALGVFRRCDISKTNPEFENSLTLRQVL